MSKITKNDLKNIVKECLIEILAEGIISSNDKLTEVSQRRKTKRQEFESNDNRRPGLDAISYKKDNSRSLKKSMPKINTNISNDSILNEIFADTAASTFQEQLAAESRRSNSSASIHAQGDQAAKIVAANNPEDLFRDSAAKWSKLAFFDQK